jgi:hypothetical protein
MREIYARQLPKSLGRYDAGRQSDMQHQPCPERAPRHSAPGNRDGEAALARREAKMIAEARAELDVGLYVGSAEVDA